MASQNIPGMAVLNANGFHPPMGPLLRMTGYFSFLANMFGGHAVNLAAITAALCSNSDADPDPKRRYWAAVVSGVLYVIFGLAAGAATAFIAASPPILIEAVAGLALLGALGASLMSAMQDAERREAALITFLLSASGLTFYGIGGAFWGLLGGGAMLALQKLKWAPLK
jgi:benzoate membrane transport protein